MEDGRWKTRSGVWRLVFGKFTVVILCLIAACLMGRGLLHSYSRGAWFATLCGLAYMLWHWINREIHEKECQHPVQSRAGVSPAPVGAADDLLAQTRSMSRRDACPTLSATTVPGFNVRGFVSEEFSSISGVSRLKNNWLPLSVMLVSAFVLVFWHFRQTEWHPARRALSAVNTVDFSWRNRIAAWEGSLQIAAEHPWFDAGWNQPEPLYEHYYLSPKLTESAAIQMNDYLMLAATLGIPALFCFGMYIRRCLGDGSWKMGDRKQQAEGQSQKSEIGSHDLKSELRSPISDLLSTTCRAGTTVLLVGFWFDGGLFKLPTAAAFWILLDLGRADLVHQKATEETKMHPIAI
jgi:hypothetical protein